MLPRNSARIRHTLREWLRLVGWAMANGGHPIHGRPAQIHYYESDARDGSEPSGRLTAEVPASDRKHVR